MALGKQDYAGKPFVNKNFKIYILFEWDFVAVVGVKTRIESLSYTDDGNLESILNI